MAGSAVTRRVLSLLIACSLMFGAQAMANTQSLESIQAAAEGFVRAGLPSGKHHVSANKLDERLRLNECAAPLEAFSQNSGGTSGRVTVGVRCSSPQTWTLYVPVSVEVEVAVLVLRRPLARRARVTMADVEPQTRLLPGSGTQFISDIANLQGHRLKRSLPVGTALTVDMLTPDLLVRRGQQVTVIAASGPVEIRAQGLALNDGAASDRVRVQNVTSLKIVEGVVESESVVRVGI
jgi:flagellar basal body P-ring formation protein FlgA